MASNNNEIEKRLWDTADQLWANTGLKPGEFSVPVLGLLFLRYAEQKFSQADKELAGKSTGRRKIGKIDYQAKGVLYLPEKSRFKELLNLPEGKDIGKAVNDKVLFIDARHIYRQIDRAHRDFTPEQIEFIANIARLYRGEKLENLHGSEKILKEKFSKGKYVDVPGLCKIVKIDEIEAQGWSLNPGRYVGVADRPQEDFDFMERIEELNEELEVLNSEARELEEQIASNVSKLLESEI